ncbi:RNA-guided endonuclease TnpB family protein [Planomonospora sp. ID82291]|uniref:RNA-guided endonuclease InsQ/TnpB family protein n=1 Tax=Planomonospora sp. ID82291 TaxID=2738136 RepID=UPI0018C356F1|nr:RNA-guided endonuclease TnpB family protein [Planomonospora sp. ID82291]MBG0818500.1 IS200/IS605 family element transposase accessory protein TnpB [Planomonospora sp. ID82291]
MRTAYKCRAYPTPEQAAVFNRTFGCVRLVWNKTLAERHAAFFQRGEKTSYKQTDAALTAWKKTEELAFLSEVSSVPLQQTLRHQHTAFGNFFAERARYPRFKPRTGRRSAHYTRSAFRIKDGELRIAKTNGPLRVAWSFSEVDFATLDPTMVIISREPDGRWYVSFAMEVDHPAPLPATGHEIGVDLGIKDFAVTSDGDRIANPRHLARKARNLARYQRRMARRQRGSANRRKAKAKVAAAHRKVRNARRDFLHKTSTALVEAADTIVLEDLAVANMVRNRSLAKAISDASWGDFRSMLEYKAARAGRHLIVIDRWYPSSKTCSGCGHLLPKLDLGTRHWTCPACRTRHDRDVNAAKNILAAGRAVAGESSGDACGADVRQQGSSLLRSAAKQEPHAARRPA